MGQGAGSFDIGAVAHGTSLRIEIFPVVVGEGQ